MYYQEYTLEINARLSDLTTGQIYPNMWVSRGAKGNTPNWVKVASQYNLQLLSHTPCTVEAGGSGYMA